MKFLRILTAILTMLMLVACHQIPETNSPIQNVKSTSEQIMSSEVNQSITEQITSSEVSQATSAPYTDTFETDAGFSGTMQFNKDSILIVVEKSNFDYIEVGTTWNFTIKDQ